MLLHDLALRRADGVDDGHLPALITTEGEVSRDRLRAEVERMAGAVASLAPLGGRIALASDSRPEVVALLLAIPAAGRVAVPLNIRLTPDEMIEQLNAVAADAVVGSAEELGRLSPAMGRAAAVRTTVGLDAGAGDISLTALTSAPVMATARATDDRAPAWIIFTSGTGGRPKGAVLTAASLAAAVATSVDARPFADDDVYLYPFPLYHVSAYNVLHALARHRPVVLPRRFDATEIIELTGRHGVTCMSLAPTMLRLLLDQLPSAPEGALAGLRTITYGAAPMPPGLLAEADATLGAGFSQGYGMTELSGNAVFLPPDDHRRGLAGDARLLKAAGRAGEGVELRITGDDGSELPAGEPGEIRVRAAQVCAGYWEDPAATAEAIEDGWLRTGDVGTLDADGLLTIVDRAKDIIVTGGENVSSREVEDALDHHPDVSRVAVFGLPDERWGEKVCAAVVLRRGAEVDPTALAADITAEAGRRLARYKVPKQIFFVDDLPVNAGGKVVKPELRRRLAPTSDPA